MIRLVNADCAWCRRRIVADLDEVSTLDWGDNGDYGCGLNPMNDVDGTWGHQPSDRRAVLFGAAVRDLFASGMRGPYYVAEARRLAHKMASLQGYSLVG